MLKVESSGVKRSYDEFYGTDGTDSQNCAGTRAPFYTLPSARSGSMCGSPLLHQHVASHSLPSPPTKRIRSFRRMSPTRTGSSAHDSHSTVFVPAVPFDPSKFLAEERTRTVPQASSSLSAFSSFSSSSSSSASSSSSSSCASYHHPSHFPFGQKSYSETEVKMLLAKAVAERDAILHDEYTQLLADRLEEQYQSFVRFNDDYITNQMKDRECTYYI